MPEDKVSQSEYNKNGIIHEEQEHVDATKTKKKKKKKALREFRCWVEDSIVSNYLLGENDKPNDKEYENLNDIKLWGVPLLPSKGQKNTDIILTKFLKAKDYKVSEAFNMLQNTMKWRRDYNVDGILEEHFNSDLENIGFINSKDKSGHPLCYQRYGIFKNKEIIRKKLGTTEACDEFLRWRIWFIEKCIRELDFKPGGSDSIVQLYDLKNVSRSFLYSIVRISRKYLLILQEHYPGIVFRNVLLNIPVWFMALHTLQLRMFAQKYDFKAIFVRPGRVTETLLRFIAPENIPVHYGGLSHEDNEFSPEDEVFEQKLKGSSTDYIQIPTPEAGMTIYWDLVVDGNEVCYKEEFVPDDECSYKVLVQKQKQTVKNVSNSFHITEPGKIVITFENATYKRRRVFYRYKIKPTNMPMYMLKKD